MKKRVILFLSLVALCCTNAMAQKSDFTRGTFNRLGVQAGVGTEGIHLGVASVYTNYLEFSLGLNIMPDIKIKSDIDVSRTVTTNGYNYKYNDAIKAEGNFGRTTLDFKANCYPFGKNSPFFVSAGFSFGGSTIAKLTGHSDKIHQEISDNPELEGKIVAELEKYNIKFDKNGDIKGELRVNGFRPYLGLGVGRMIPKHRVGFRFELGCHFMGKVKVYQNGSEVDMNDLSDGGGDFSKIKESPIFDTIQIGL